MQSPQSFISFVAFQHVKHVDDIPALKWAVAKLKTMPGSLELNAPFLQIFQAIVIVFAGQRVTEEKAQGVKQLEAKVFDLL